MKYYINIHAHSYFSDGLSSPLAMAIAAKDLGFTALVLTEHYEDLMTQNLKTYKKATQEAKAVLPVITGIEIPFEGQHILVFGGAAIKDILENGPRVKPDPATAYVLAHHHGGYTGYYDAYEAINSGNSHAQLPGQAWCNSDAHKAEDLARCYNVVDTKITLESDLIRFIKRQRPVEFKI